MSINTINTLPLQQFINQVKSADSSKQKEIRMDIDTAKNLAFTLGIVMSRLNGGLEEQIKYLLENQNTEQNITVKLDGGNSL
jgi:hypothetical protein